MLPSTVSYVSLFSQNPTVPNRFRHSSTTRIFKNIQQSRWAATVPQSTETTLVVVTEIMPKRKRWIPGQAKRLSLRESERP